MVFAGIFTVLWYFKKGAIQVINTVGEFNQAQQGPAQVPKFKIATVAKGHIAFLGGIIVLIIAWSYYLKVYGLMYSTNGAAFGPCYTDVHIRMPAYIAIALASIIFSIFLFKSAFRFRGKKIITIVAIIWVGLIFVVANLVPIAVQKLVVKPNELAKESKYIAKKRNCIPIPKIINEIANGSNKS